MVQGADTAAVMFVARLLGQWLWVLLSGIAGPGEALLWLEIQLESVLVDLEANQKAWTNQLASRGTTVGRLPLPRWFIC